MNYALVGDIRMIDIKKPAEESASDFSRETILRRISACTSRPGATRGLPGRGTPHGGTGLTDAGVSCSAGWRSQIPMLATSMVSLVDELAFVVPGGRRPVPAEPVDRPLHRVAGLVGLLVELLGRATFGTTTSSARDLVRRLRDRRRDTSAPHRIPDLPGGIRLVPQHSVRPGPGGCRRSF